jgi:hypothetical protein
MTTTTAAIMALIDGELHLHFHHTTQKTGGYRGVRVCIDINSDLADDGELEARQVVAQDLLPVRFPHDRTRVGVPRRN